MNTLTLIEPGKLSLSHTDAPAAPGPGEALVRVRRVGICGTDIHAFHGRQPFFTYPRILGHELGVEVLEVGEGVPALGSSGAGAPGNCQLKTEDRRLKPGDRCAVEPYLYCGRCIACRQGKTNCCANLRVLGVHTDGGMREVIAVPANNLHRSDTLTLEQLALVETLGIGAHAVDRAGVRSGEWALVLGAGPIGLAVTQFADAAGARVLVADVNEERLAFCRNQFPIDRTLPAGESLLEEARAATEGDLPTVAFDVTGNAASMTGAFQYVAPGGRLVFVGLVQADITFHDPEFHRKEITLLATRNSTGADFRRIIGLMESRRIDTTPWITHRAACQDLPASFPVWLQPGSGLLKGMVEF